MRPASYIGGMYPLIGEPLYRELWRGCVGAWAPCLGPTGATLRDWSGFGRHATISNANLSTIWTPDGGRFCLDGDGTDDHATTQFSPQFGSQPFAMSLWANGENSSRFGSLFNTRKTSFDPYTETVFGVAHGNFLSGAASQLLSFGVLQTLSNYRVYVTSTTVFDAAWHHIAVNWTGSTAEIYVDGIIRGTTVSSAGSVPTANASGNVGLLAGNDGVTAVADKIDDTRLYSRLLTTAEIRVLAKRRGIAYELAPRRRSRVFGGFKAAWAARKAQIIGGGLN